MKAFPANTATHHCPPSDQPSAKAASILLWLLPFKEKLSKNESGRVDWVNQAKKSRSNHDRAELAHVFVMAKG